MGRLNTQEARRASFYRGTAAKTEIRSAEKKRACARALGSVQIRVPDSDPKWRVSWVESTKVGHISGGFIKYPRLRVRSVINYAPKRKF